MTTLPGLDNYLVAETTPEPPAPITMADLWELNPEKAQAIFLEVIEGYEWEVWNCLNHRLNNAHARKIIDRCEEKVN